MRAGGAMVAALAAMALVPVSSLRVAAAAPEPVTWKVRSAPAAPVKAGAVITIGLVAEIQEGWHIYGLRPVEDGPIPTRVWLAAGQAFEASGAVKADEPESVEDQTLHAVVDLYEGQAHFELPVRATAAAPAGAQKIVINASYQSCNNSLCLPPKTVKIEVPVTVVK